MENQFNPDYDKDEDKYPRFTVLEDVCLCETLALDEPQVNHDIVILELQDWYDPPKWVLFSRDRWDVLEPEVADMFSTVMKPVVFTPIKTPGMGEIMFAYLDKRPETYFFNTLDNSRYESVVTSNPDETANELSRQWRVHVEEIAYELDRETLRR